MIDISPQNYIDILSNLHWISTEIDAEAGTPTPLLAVQMYSPFAWRSTSTRSRDRPDRGDIDPTCKHFNNSKI